MKTVKILTLLGVTLFLQACSSTASNDENTTNQPASHFYGKLVLGTQTQVFTPCNSHVQYQITLPHEQLKKVAPHLKHPYDELHVELTGNLSVPSRTGYNADYRAILHTQEIVSIKPSGVRCNTETNQPSQRWTGRYSAQSTTSGLITTLELKPDHSARTTYTYTNGSLPVTEDGFWQAINPNQIQVTMTLHQQQYLVTERMFTLKGNSIFASKEKIGQKEYAISQGGLLLFKEKQ